MTNNSIPEIEGLSGKGAVFVRNFMETFLDGDNSLRRCQEAGKLAIEEQEDTVSVPYISKLSKMLVTSRVVGRKKTGRHYVVTDSTFTKDFQTFLAEHPFWGDKVGAREEEPLERMVLLNHLEKYNSVRSTAANRIPKAAYRLMMEKVNKGEYDMVFVPAGWRTRTVDDDGVVFKVLPIKQTNE